MHACMHVCRTLRCYRARLCYSYAIACAYTHGYRDTRMCATVHSACMYVRTYMCPPQQTFTAQIQSPCVATMANNSFAVSSNAASSEHGASSNKAGAAEHGYQAASSPSARLCFHCGSFVGRIEAARWYSARCNAFIYHSKTTRSYCDDCIIWWNVHAIYWKLWYVLRLDRDDGIAAFLLNDENIARHVCSFLPLFNARMILSEPCQVMMSRAAAARGRLLGLNTRREVLLRLLTDFHKDPSYLLAKGFAFIESGAFYMVTVEELH